VSAPSTTASGLLTAEQVAAILSVSERYVWRLGRDGELPRVQLGKYVRFDPADVEAFIEARKESAPGRRVHLQEPRERPASAAASPGPRRRF
jgi:excisionase family DNA binding protein